MKKFIALALAVMLLGSIAVPASAASTTTLTTTVPAASYTLNIPANQEITFGTTRQSIGNVTVTDASGFAVGKNLDVTITYDAFAAEGISSKIPYSLSLSGQNSRYKAIASGDVVTFDGKENGTVVETLFVEDNYEAICILFTAENEDWGKALAGEYTSTITFTAEVVVEG